MDDRELDDKLRTIMGKMDDLTKGMSKSFAKSFDDLRKQARKDADTNRRTQAVAGASMKKTTDTMNKSVGSFTKSLSAATKSLNTFTSMVNKMNSPIKDFNREVGMNTKSMARLNNREMNRLFNSISKTSRGLDSFDNMFSRIDKSSRRFTNDLAKNADDFLKGKGSDRDHLKGDLYGKRRGGGAKGLLNAGGNATKTLYELTTSVHSATNMLENFAGMFVGGAIATVLFKASSDYISTYKSLSDVGQTFSGSMLQMGTAAAQAGMPLDDFANALKNNSKIVAKYGSKEFFDLSKSVRQASYDFGMFGMSTAEMTDSLGEYMENQRLLGLIDNINKEKEKSSYMSLMEQTTKLAAAMGVSRKEVLNSVNDVMRTSNVIAALHTLPKTMQDAARKSVEKAASVFGSQGGSVAQIMNDALSKSLGSGMSIHSDLGRTLAATGGGQLIGEFDKVLANIKKGTATEEELFGITNQIKEFYNDPARLQGLNLMAQSGDAGAQQMLDLWNNIKVLSKEEIEKMKNQNIQTDALTSILTSLTDIYNQLSGAFTSGFMEAIGGFATDIKDFRASDTFAYLTEQAHAFGKTIGEFISNIDWGMVSSTIKSMYETMSSFVSGIPWDKVKQFFVEMDWNGIKAAAYDAGQAIVNLGKWAWDLVSSIGLEDFKEFGRSVVDFTTKLISVGNVMLKAFQWMIDNPEWAVGMALGLKFLPKILKGLAGVIDLKTAWSGQTVDTMTVNARVVNVYGGKVNDNRGGGNGPDGPDSPDEKKGKKGGKGGGKNRLGGFLKGMGGKGAALGMLAAGGYAMLSGENPIDTVKNGVGSTADTFRTKGFAAGADQTIGGIAGFLNPYSLITDNLDSSFDVKESMRKRMHEKGIAGSEIARQEYLMERGPFQTISDIFNGDFMGNKAMGITGDGPKIIEPSIAEKNKIKLEQLVKQQENLNEYIQENRDGVFSQEKENLLKKNLEDVTKAIKELTELTAVVAGEQLKKQEEANRTLDQTRRNTSGSN